MLVKTASDGFEGMLLVGQSAPDIIIALTCAGAEQAAASDTLPDGVTVLSTIDDLDALEPLLRKRDPGNLQQQR